MKFHLFKYTCNQCGATYKAPELSFDSYGQFLMRSPAGETVYLNALSDHAYTEVDKLLKTFPNLQKLSPTRLAKIQKNIFGVACDVDSHGNRYSIENRPICASCGNNEPSYWEATEPPEHVNVDFPAVTHQAWEALTEPEKITLLKKDL